MRQNPAGTSSVTPDQRPGTEPRARAAAFSANTRVDLLQVTVALGMIAGMGVSWPLWLSRRNYPMAPVFEWLPRVARPVDVVIFACTLAMLGLSIVLRPSWTVLAIALALVLALAALDQTRWQPWAYQYTCMLGVLAVLRAGALTQVRAEAALNAGGLIVAFTYMWSGLHKLNGIYWDEGFPIIVEPLTRHLAPPLKSIVLHAAIPSAALEALTGLGLLWRPTRRLCVLLSAAMHIFLLLCLGPLGQAWNPVVWPWNVVMILQVVILFWGRDVSMRAIVVPRPPMMWVRIATLALFGALPTLSFFDRWDTNLSGSLYSGNIIRGIVYVSPTVAHRMSEGSKRFVHFNDAQKRWYVDIGEWAFAELKVPAYPARRVMKRIAREF